MVSAENMRVPSAEMAPLPKVPSAEHFASPEENQGLDKHREGVAPYNVEEQADYRAAMAGNIAWVNKDSRVAAALVRGDAAEYRAAVTSASVAADVHANLRFADARPDIGAVALQEWVQFKQNYEQEHGVTVPDYDFGTWAWDHDIPQSVRALRGVAVAYEHRQKQHQRAEAERVKTETNTSLAAAREVLGLPLGEETPPSLYKVDRILAQEPANEVTLQEKFESEALEDEVALEAATQANVSDKRFIISKDPFVLERLHAAQDVIADIRAEKPEVLSLSVFGSTTKGTAKESSDIDGWLFVDAEAAAARYKDKFELDDSGFSRQLAEEYASDLRERMQNKIGLAPDQVEHLRVLPISERIIDKSVAKIIEQVRAYHEYKAQRELFRQGQMETSPDQVGMPEVPLSLYSMFHLTVGNGMRTYRKYLLSKLQSMGSQGERVWQEIIRDTEMVENHKSKKYYPRTLKQAVSMYGS